MHTFMSNVDKLSRGPAGFLIGMSVYASIVFAIPFALASF